MGGQRADEGKARPAAGEGAQGPAIARVKRLRPAAAAGRGPEEKKFIVFLTESKVGVVKPGLAGSRGIALTRQRRRRRFEHFSCRPPGARRKNGLAHGTAAARREATSLGGSVEAEIVLDNNGKQDWKLPQHRFNIYDYWPNTWLKVIDPDGARNGGPQASRRDGRS